MKRIELTVLEKDADVVIEFLGRSGLIQFSSVEETLLPEENRPETEFGFIEDRLERLKSSALYLGLELPTEPYETTRLPTQKDEQEVDDICVRVTHLREREYEEIREKQKLEDVQNESKAFVNLNASFSELDQLSYLTLRVGRLDPHGIDAVRKNLADRATIIPLDDGRVLAASSRKGRFALDSELKKQDFSPIAIPKDYKGIPADMLAGLEERQKSVKSELQEITAEKKRLQTVYGFRVLSLVASYIMAEITEKIKVKLISTKNVCFLSGWVPADCAANLTTELLRITSGRIGARTLDPNEVESVRNGTEKVPTALSHGKFASSFEPLVFSYGAPLYGSIDPTFFVAVFFTLLFGVMFGDVGQGCILLLLGILIKKRKSKILAGFKNFGGPLIYVGIFSMFMGLLYGGVFSNETLLEAPTRALTGFLANTDFGRLLNIHETGKILHLMPEKGSIDKLFYFFGFTLSLGVILNSAGLIFNIANQFLARNYEKALFSKTGIAGALFFWWVIGIAVRMIAHGQLYWFDIPCIAVPLLCVFFGPLFWRLISGEKPKEKEGLLVFIMEGTVEILETFSSYISNSVSFLRVGAFALSHAVLSFITFTMAELVGHNSLFGPVFSAVVIIFGNLIIIVLEGMIVAIQVTRLQYYEFFSKFWTESGVKFAPFRFRKE
ncbi:MAG: V-type ATP synthase subunit I [Treponema sp.]|jgi:V/A-type H+-transporting ATPase subunit I|nr:V-type ATP synthase subunit I [Treponema sp.]